jgi:hypothetical protein
MFDVFHPLFSIRHARLCPTFPHPSSRTSRDLFPTLNLELETLNPRSSPSKSEISEYTQTYPNNSWDLRPIGAWFLEFLWALDIGHWTLDIGHWSLEFMVSPREPFLRRFAGSPSRPSLGIPHSALRRVGFSLTYPTLAHPAALSNNIYTINCSTWNIPPPSPGFEISNLQFEIALRAKLTRSPRARDDPTWVLFVADILFWSLEGIIGLLP